MKEGDLVGDRNDVVFQPLGEKDVAVAEQVDARLGNFTKRRIHDVKPFNVG